MYTSVTSVTANDDVTDYYTHNIWEEVESELRSGEKVRLLGHPEEGVCAMCGKDDEYLTHVLASRRFCYECGVKIS